MSEVKYFEINKEGQVFEARDGKWVMRSDYNSLLAEKSKGCSCSQMSNDGSAAFICKCGKSYCKI